MCIFRNALEVEEETDKGFVFTNLVSYGTSVWVPRRKTAVKIKSVGAVDIHFHGAFGIDLMTARNPELDELALLLGKRGVAAFCPTTLSVPFPALRAAVRRLGDWIALRSQKPTRRDPGHGALPARAFTSKVPIFIPVPAAPTLPEAIRRLRSRKSSKPFWEESCQGQLKFLTVAPELLQSGDLKKLARRASSKGITLSLGHSRATEAQAHQAFEAGFSNVTHAWNAVGFHQRSPRASWALPSAGPESTSR